MGFVDYSLPTADRDDYEESEHFSISTNDIGRKSTEIESKPKEEKPKKEKLDDLPLCFDEDYYLTNLSKCQPNTKNYSFWVAVKEYAEAVKQFYIANYIKLNYSLNNPRVMPNYIEKAKSNLDLSNLSRALLEKEKVLIEVAKNNNLNLQSKFADAKILSELRNFGAQSWMLFYNNKGDNFFASPINFQEKFENFDLDKDVDVAHAYAIINKLKSFISTKIKNYFKPTFEENVVDIVLYRTPNFAQTNGCSMEIYKNMSGEELFKDIITTFKGFDVDAHFGEVFESAKHLTDALGVKIAQIYDSYHRIKHTYKCLSYRKRYETEGVEIGFKETKTGTDIFVEAEKYLARIENLLSHIDKDGEYGFAFKDLIHFKNKLEQFINENKQDHYNMDITEKYLESNPNGLNK